jgi:hypothetical protein
MLAYLMWRLNAPIFTENLRPINIDQLGKLMMIVHLIVIFA